MILAGSWFSNTLVTAGLTGDQIGTFLVPPVEPGADPAVFVESAALAVPRNAHKHDAAVDVARAWLAPDVQAAWTGFLQDSSANPQVPAPSPLIEDLKSEVAATAPRELVRYWEASPPALVEGNVLDLGGFMADPTPANARATLRSMARRARTEWETWRTS
jgi:multiple sugar transport system substrate-binding protein